MNRRSPSLRWPLTVQPLLLQLAILFISFSIIVALATRLDSGGPYTDETITPVIAQAIARDDGGRLFLRRTQEMLQLQADTPNLWFIAQDDAGGRVSFGPVPEQYAAFNAVLRDLSYGHVRGRASPYALTAVIRREDSPIGPLTIMGHGKLTKLGITVILASSLTVVPIFVLMALVSLVAIPWIVRRSLVGVARIAHEADRIGAGRRGTRLSEDEVPEELAPLVRAVNDALGRLDEGYEQQRRFIASAAHELRTPIAILRLKIEAAQEESTRRLGSDIERLANLAEQMLDIQRLDASSPHKELDLASLVRQVAADLAPLLVSMDRSIEVTVDRVEPVRGDAGAIERVLTNLVQNAVHHGGRHVVVRVFGTAFEVEDDGPGIPVAARERVFEPFYRLQPRSSGAGLGLHFVKQVVEHHRGRVSVLDAPGGGTVARVIFPPAGPSQNDRP